MGHSCANDYNTEDNRNSIGFLAEWHYEPDIVSTLMMRSGDIETNPGPVMTRRQSQRKEEENRDVGEKARLEEETKQTRTPVKVTRKGKLPRRKAKTPPKKRVIAIDCGDPECITPLDGRSVKVKCSECSKQYHKLCAGERSKMDRIIKIKALLEKWRCKSCVSGNTNQENATNQVVPDVQPEVQPELQEQPTEREETTEEKKLCMHVDCGKPIRGKGVECSECKGVVHAQPEC